MPSARDEKPIADKYSLSYIRRPLATRRWKPSWNWWALAAAALLVGVLYLLWGDAIFWAAPVTEVHASFGSDCSSCHTDKWQAGVRLATGSSDRHSVSDAACRECHQTADHHPRDDMPEPACASCHQEHREMPLTAVADRQCVACHGNLAGDMHADINFVGSISQFATGDRGHPEFAVLRDDSDVGSPHGARQVALPASDGSGWLDRGGLMFNHKLHLDAEGVLDADRNTVQLQCADCHVLDTAGEYMKPFSYEQHCAECHPLRLTGQFADLGELPHERPELVRGVLRERIARQIVEEVDPTDTPATTPRLPGPAPLSVDQDQSAAERLAKADQAVFGLEAKGYCRKCHHVQMRGEEWHVPLVDPAVAIGDSAQSADSARPIAPERWLLHGNFNHLKHRTVACEACHAAGQSSETTDILLPSIATCRECHAASPSTMALGNRVSAECVLCHDYHGHAEGVPRGVELERLFAHLRN